MSDALFHVEPIVHPNLGDELSADRRRTLRQAEALTRGRHPLGLALGFPLSLHAEAAPADDRSAPGRRCGDCRFREVLGYHSRSYPKCTFGGTDRGLPRVTHGSGTDVRGWWPACRDYEPADPADPRGKR